MAEYKDLVVRIKGDTNDFESSMGRVKTHSENSGLSFAKLTGAVAAGQAIFSVAKIGIEKMAGGLMSTIKSANDSENAMAQLESVLKSTGHAAGLAEDQLSEQATALQKLTTFNDEAIMSAQSLLLTFTNVKNEVFKDSIPLILDMSQALGQDLKSSTIQLGKALNDPIKGITALSRVGVSFTEQQKKQIESFVKAGKTMEAQKIILRELRTEFGGSAEAAGKTFAGSLERLKNQLDDVKESLGQTIVKGITPFTQKAADLVAKIDWEAVLNKSVNALKGFWQWLQPPIQSIKEFARQAGEFLMPAFQHLWETIEVKMIPALKRFWKEVLEPLMPVLGTALVLAIYAVITAFDVMIQAQAKLYDGIIAVKKAVLEAKDWLVNAFQVVRDKLMWLKDNWAEAVGMIIGFVATLPIRLVALMAEAVVGMWKVALSIDWGKVASSIFDAFKWWFREVYNAGRALFNDLVHLDWGRILINVGKGLSNNIIGMVEGAINGALAGVPGKPKISLPRFESGVRNFSGGLAIVGDVNGRGGEIVELPRGSNVYTNAESKQMLSGGGSVSLNVNVGMYAGMPVEKRQIALELYKELVRAARAQGVQLPMIGAIGVQ